MLDTVKINHVQHISFTQSRLTDAVSVILSELLSYEHPSKGVVVFWIPRKIKMLGRSESALRQGFRLGENACTAQTRRRPGGR